MKRDGRALKDIQNPWHAVAYAFRRGFRRGKRKGYEEGFVAGRQSLQHLINELAASNAYATELLYGEGIVEDVDPIGNEVIQ